MLLTQLSFFLITILIRFLHHFRLTLIQIIHLVGYVTLLIFFKIKLIFKNIYFIPQLRI